MRSRVDQIQCFMHSNRGCYITITIEQIENPDEHYNSISLEEIKFPTIQRYFLRGNNTISFRNNVSLSETVC